MSRALKGLSSGRDSGSGYQKAPEKDENCMLEQRLCRETTVTSKQLLSLSLRLWVFKLHL